MSAPDYSNVPGWEIISAGLSALEQGDENSTEALCVRMIAPRLVAFGIPFNYQEKEEPLQIRLKMYYSLADQLDPYSAFNALQRRLASFCSIAESMMQRSSSR